MDFHLEHLINSAAGHCPVLDRVMIYVASWGEGIFISVIALWFLIGWWRGLSMDREGAITALVGTALALLTNQVISHIWTRSRPFVAHPHSVHLLLAHSTDASFPSDHASAGFAIAAVLFARHRRVGIIALLFALFMSYARVYVGDHYPGDVAAGAVVGVIVAALLLTWLEPVMAMLRRLGDRVILLVHLPLPRENA